MLRTQSCGVMATKMHKIHENSAAQVFVFLVHFRGYNPNDDTSYFAITNWSGGSFSIEWPAFPGRVYQVLRADSLTNDFIPFGDPINYPQNSYTESSLGESGFYKVEVQLQ